MEGLSGRGRAVDVLVPSATRNISTGSVMFLSRCRPAGAKGRPSLPLTALKTLRDIHTPPGSHKDSIRAATLTPSP
jgi:hypothetical protein